MSGLISGALRRFTVKLLSAVGASLIGYIQLGAGAILRTIQDVMRERISVLDFADGPLGVDDTAMFVRAANFADGRRVDVPPGVVYKITTNIDALSTATEFRFVGSGAAYVTHGAVAASNNYSSDYSPASLDNIAARAMRMTVIHCVNCSLFGAPDDATMRATDKVKQLESLFIFGSGGAKIGLHIFPTDALVRNCTIALFEWFGMLTRGGVTSSIEKVAYVDNGWNLAETGAIGIPSNYGSGCGLKIGGSMMPGKYHGITSTQGATTFSFSNLFFNVRGHYCNTFSGLRGIQAHGLLSGFFSQCGGYIGNYLNVCTVTMLGNHFENYGRSGLVAGDQVPYCIYAVDSGLTHEGVHALMTPFVHDDAVKSYGTGATGLPNNNTDLRGGRVVAQAPLLSKHKKRGIVTAKGTTVVYNLPGMLNRGDGFTGILSASVTKVSDYSIYATKVVAAHWHAFGASARAEPPTPLHSFNTGQGNYLNQITSLVVELNGSVSVSVQWGPLWADSDEFEIVVGLVGGGASSIR